MCKNILSKALIPFVLILGPCSLFGKIDFVHQIMPVLTGAELAERIESRPQGDLVEQVSQLAPHAAAVVHA